AIITLGTASPDAFVKVATANRYAVLLTGPPRSRANIRPMTAPINMALVPDRETNKFVNPILIGLATRLTTIIDKEASIRPTIGYISSVLIPSRDLGNPLVIFINIRMI